MDAKRPRGRPRPQETIERDSRVLRLLQSAGPQTRNDLADQLGEDKGKIWLALDRLRTAGHVRLCGPAGGPEAKWTAGPCP